MIKASMGTKSAQKYCNNHGNERGNVLWFIMIGVALLGAITMVLSRGGSSVESTGSYEHNSVKLSQIMRYTKGLEAAVSNLKILGGCSENEISFENPREAEYINTNSPADKSCHIFQPNGAGQVWQNLTRLTPASMKNADMFFTGSVELDGVGRDAGPDLLLMMNLSKDLCLQLNKKLGISTAPSDLQSGINTSLVKYTGNFSPLIKLGGSAANQASGVNGYNLGCVLDTTNNYIFYQTLIAR
ncbi:MAG: hypothetical protein CBB87_01730 [Micavibrio sp. TMED27]|nr:hypothetical protein [Micavibrio sp.]OUT92485.1 MAG: hypothetical protein CBB87_01730 [Micavibrio sp. TMED27]|tara:strand:+ start:492 stop:1220 length:729 start_codon:yes stop_codon:yes gene_type:complete